MNHWALIRAGIIVLVGGSSMLSPIEVPAGSAAEWEVVVVGFLFFPAIVAIGLAVLLPFSHAKLNLQHPSWALNPFNFSQPEQFFHMAAYAMLVSGVGMGAVEAVGSNAVHPYHLAPAAMGAGVLVGLRILGGVSRRQETTAS